MKKFFLILSQYFWIVLFLLTFWVFALYGWLRFFYKKIFRLKPAVLFWGDGTLMAFLSARAVKTQKVKVDVLATHCQSYFESISWGTNINHSFWLKFLAYSTDYLIFFLWGILKFDIFESSFYGGILRKSHLRKIEYLLLKLAAKKVVIYGYGSDCKVLSDVKKQGKYNNAMDRDGKDEGINDNKVRQNLRRAQKYADVLIGGGDLIHLGPKAIFLPLAVDFSKWHYSPLKKNNIVTFIHSTNHRSHKGSRFIIDAFKKLEPNLSVRLLLVEGKTMAECKKLYQKGDAFITDVITGWHGLTACEAMFLGRPVISYLRQDISRFHNYYARKIPIQSANPINLKKQIIRLAKDFKLRKELGQQGREYVQKVHSLETVGRLRTLIYEYIWCGKKINQKIFEKEVLKRKIIG